MMKLARKGPFLCGVSGAVAPAQRFLDWFQSGLKGDPPVMPDGDKTTFALVVLPSDLVLTYGPTGWERTRAAQVGMGSGGDFATGAMSAGATARHAVEIACMHDTKSGPPIVEMRR